MRLALAPLASLSILLLLLVASCRAEPPANANAASPATKTAAKDAPMPDHPLQTATFGNGCFWCTEAIFERLRGVHSVTSGYAGGKDPNPSYREVCSGLTGHAEAIRIEYDPKEISFSDILDIFFATHDPTTLNRQGADVGTQYRSVVFCEDEEQRAATVAKIAELTKAKAFADPIVTEVAGKEVFYPAEAYHQDYYKLNPNQGYCRAVIAPKIAKFEKLFKDKVKH